MKIETKCEIGKFYHFFDTEKRGPFVGQCVGIHIHLSLYGSEEAYNVFDCDGNFIGGYDEECFDNLAECCLFIKNHTEYGTTD